MEHPKDECVTVLGKPLREVIHGDKHPEGYRRWDARRFPFYCIIDSRDETPGQFHWTLYPPEIGRIDGVATSRWEAAFAIDAAVDALIEDFLPLIERVQAKLALLKPPNGGLNE